MARQVGTPGPEPVPHDWVEEYRAMTQLGFSRWEMIRAMKLSEEAFDKRVHRLRQLQTCRSTATEP